MPISFLLVISPNDRTFGLLNFFSSFYHNQQSLDLFCCAKIVFPAGNLKVIHLTSKDLKLFCLSAVESAVIFYTCVTSAQVGLSKHAPLHVIKVKCCKQLTVVCRVSITLRGKSEVYKGLH